MAGTYDPTSSRLSGSTSDSLNEIILRLKELLTILPSIAPTGLATETTLQTIATESTLQSVLMALQSSSEFEQNLVVDSANNTYLQIRIFNPDTSTFDAPIYYDASGAVAVPVPPLTLVNVQFVLDNILVQVSGINTLLTNFDRDSGQTTAETLRVALSNETQSLINSIDGLVFSLNDYAAAAAPLIVNIDAIIQTLQTLLVNFDRDGGAATPETLRVVPDDNSVSILTGIKDFVEILNLLSKDAGSTDVNTLRVEVANKQRTPTILRSSVVGSIPLGSKQASILNAGATNGLVLSAVLKPGEVISFEAELNDTLAAIDYDGTGTDLLITYIV